MLFILFGASAQHKITGKVISTDGKKPIASASIFFSNTSKGSISNEQGAFEINNIGDGKYDLVASCMGYETKVQTVQPSKITEPIIIELKPKVAELKEVVVGGYVKEGWAQWGQFFLDNFIGQSSYAQNCTIKNPETIQFRNYKKQRLLKVFADETLVIENNSLGYIIRYSLELFQYDFKTGILLYQGYPLFEKMETKRERKQERWDEKRSKVYYGSQLHFMRSLFRNKVAEQGFEIRKLVKEPNLEKQRIKALYATSIIRKTAGNIVTIERPSYFKDSAAYYENILSQPDEKEIVFPGLLISDSIAYAVNPTTVGLDFTDYLRITYTRIKEDDDYLLQRHINRQAMTPVSLLKLINNQPIQIFADGLYYESLDLLNSGYWAWSEKMATMLPYDYWPAKK